MVAISVWESAWIGVGDGWGSVVIGMVESVSICQIVGISLRVSLGLALLSLSLNSFSFGLSFNRLCENIRISVISITVGVSISMGVWENMVGGISDNRCLNFDLLDNRLNNRGGGVDNGTVDSICQIVRISLRLSLGLTLFPLSFLHSGSISFSGSSGSSYDWESMSPESIVRDMKIRITIGDNWSSLNLSGLFYNRLDNRYMGDSMVSNKSMDKRRGVDQLRISLSLSLDSSKEGNHQQELHVVTGL